MKAVVLGEFHQAPEIVDLDIPSPEANEVRVRVHAASVNGFDVAVANSYLKDAMEHRFPVVLGKDFAGVVDQIGDGVTGFAEGDRVFGVVAKEFLGDGSFAEYVTVPASVGIAKLPDSVSFTDAAALGLAGTAAVDAVDAAGIAGGSTVLIAGATGGVGQQTVQLARVAGATVIATAASPEEIATVRGLGASETVDYTGDIAAQVRETHPDGVNVVLHFAGDPSVLAGLVSPGGVFVSTVVLDPSQITAEDIRVVPIYAQPTTATLERIVNAHADGHTTVTVQQVYMLDKTPDALGQFTAGTLGKLVISID